MLLCDPFGYVLFYNPIDIRRYKEYLQFIKNDDPIEPGKGIFGYPIIQPFPIENKRLLDLLGAKYAFGFLDENLRFSAAGEPGHDPAWEKLPLEDRNAEASFLAEACSRSRPTRSIETTKSPQVCALRQGFATRGSTQRAYSIKGYRFSP